MKEALVKMEIVLKIISALASIQLCANFLVSFIFGGVDDGVGRLRWTRNRQEMKFIHMQKPVTILFCLQYFLPLASATSARANADRD